MDEQLPQPEMTRPEPVKPAPADDCGTIYLDGAVRIFDPNTGETILETRT